MHLHFIKYTTLTPRLLRAIVLHGGFLSFSFLRGICTLHTMSDRPKVLRLGEALLSLGHVTPEILAEALKRQTSVPDIRIGRILIDLGISEDIVTDALAMQASLERYRISEAALSPDIARKVPAEYARMNRIVPVALRNGKLIVATSDPNSIPQVEMIGKFLRHQLQIVLASDSEIEIGLDRLYGRQTDVIPIDRRLQEKRSSETKSDEEDPAAVRVLDSLLSRAVRDGASDIHIEPFDSVLRARLRIDGVLHSVAVEAVAPRALAARCKILAELDTAESRRPQDGHFRQAVENRTLDVRVSTVPIAHGEKVVLRIQDRSKALLDLDTLGMPSHVLSTFRGAVNRPHGLILVTGPTGSGKTTTLYAALSERNDGRLNITTIEDPVELELHGISQIQVHPKIDLNFAKGLRHVLRQDPDIILVGEIRDRETAEVAIQAAMTGHLVLSTLHTNDSVGAIARLLDMKIDAFLLAHSLIGVLSQRLVRRVCVECAGKGCPTCLATGYRGRLGLYEMLAMNDEIRRLVHDNARSEDIFAAAVRSGFQTLRQNGLKKVSAGLTTQEEVDRVS